MGLRSSKHKRNSYDIAPVVSNKDFSYKKNPKSLPKVELPAATAVVAEENEEIVNENGKTEDRDPRIPEWINENNFKKLLLKSQPNIKDITSFKAFPALAAGENYATLMLRVKISAKFEDETTKDFSYMIKVAHDTQEMKEMMKAMNFFIVENIAYTEVLPELEEMYRQAGVEVTFGPKSHRLDLEDPNAHYVLMEDLSVDGFKNANRLECLDMDHTLSVLRKMAQFHAATACRVAKNGAYSAVFSPDMDNDMARVMLKQMFMAFKEPFLNNLKNFENGEKYRESMAHFFDNLVELFIRGRKFLNGYFSVLNHGDSWSNNILFKYSAEGKLEETLFVDFQNTNWGSPAMDLYYFIISSVQIDIKLTHFDYFIRYYHEHLTKHLKLLEYPLVIPNLREFHMQLIDFGAMATMTAFLTLGVVLLDSTDAAKFENFMSDTEEGAKFRNAMYTNPRYIKYINEILPWLYNRGFMEINLTDLDNRIAAADKLKNEATLTSVTIETTSGSANSYPEWVNETLFIDVVRADCENFEKILKFTISPATNAGDNYSSIMLKIVIDIELKDHTTRSLSYMLKIPPAGENTKAIMDVFKTFEREMKAYNEIIPEIERVYKERTGHDIAFAPITHKLKLNSENEYLLMENLRVKGFQNCDRLQGLDLKHTEAALKKLAEFHAISAYLFETRGKFPEVFEHSTYTEDTAEVRKKINDAFLKLHVECVRQYEGHEKYIDKLETFINDPDSYLVPTAKIDWNKFNVLNHGDCWTNNIMFQYDEEGNIVNTLFVDYQMVQYGSPSYDLYYFLMSSPKLALKLEQFDYLVRHYHSNLKATLELLKYPKEIPTLKDLHIELLEKGVWALNTVMSIMSAVLLDPSKKPSVEKMISEDDDAVELRKDMFLNKLYRSHAEALYPWMHRRGLLDFNIFVKNIPPPLDFLKAVKVRPAIRCMSRNKIQSNMSDNNNGTDQNCDNQKAKIPSWIQSKLFEDLLKNLFKNFQEILEFKVDNALAPGENYATVMLKVEIVIKLKDGSTQPTSFMLKIGHDTELFHDLMKNHNVFAIEAGMYSDSVPEFEQLYADAGMQVKFGPISYQLPTNHYYILLENLKVQGFKNVNRLEGLDVEHTKSVLRKLAQWHAASAVRVEQKGLYPRDYCTAYLKPEGYEMIKTMFDGSTNILLECVKEYRNSDLYYDKVEKLQKQITDEIYKIAEADSMEFNVLNHGDCWSNNIMFKYDQEGKLIDTLLIDFQMPRYGSPAQDLMYFLLSSTKLEIKLKDFDYFIKFYHDNLVENLKILKYGKHIPCLRELHCMIYKNGVFGYMTSTNVMAAVLCDPTDNASIDNFIQDTEDGAKFRKQMYSNPRYRKHMEAIFPWLLNKGMLDFSRNTLSNNLASIQAETSSNNHKNIMSNSTENVPKWIESKLFENALKESFGEFKNILNFKAYQALPPGENYATVMIKIETDVLLNNGDIHKQSFMLKVAHDSELQRKEMSKWDMFTTESGMYQDIIPEFEKMYADVGVKVKFGAKSYKLPIQKEYILLEDLTKRGFKNSPRREGLDMVHCESVLRKLAQWHAASAVRIENKGKFEYKYARGMFLESGKNLIGTMMESSLKHLINSAKRLPNHNEYLAQLEALQGNITDIFFTLSKKDEKELNVLNHGDCWSNNIMFQYNEDDKLQETYFVDLQVPNYGSPAQDLYYFIITSSQLEIKIHKFDQMIKYYYDHLIENLKLLKYKKSLPLLKELQMSLIRYSFWGFFAAFAVLPVVLCDPSEKASVDNLVGDNQDADNFKQKMFSNERFTKHLEVVLPWLCYRGAFEY
ncbi:uncharacterized protein ACRADG_013297 [Cochliomyia hominivorax]